MKMEEMVNGVKCARDIKDKEVGLAANSRDQLIVQKDK